MSFHASKVIHNFLNLLSILEKGITIVIRFQDPRVSIALPSTRSFCTALVRLGTAVVTIIERWMPQVVTSIQSSHCYTYRATRELNILRTMRESHIFSLKEVGKREIMCVRRWRRVGVRLR